MNWKIILKDPKTTIGGMVGAAAQILKFAKVVDFPPEVLDAITFLALSFALMFAADTKENP